MRRILSAFVLGLACTMLLSGIAVADPITGRDTLKFSQQPMLATTLVGPNGTTEIFNGHDEPSTAYSVTDPLTGAVVGYRGQFMADDFADLFKTPVVHVKWWGSYLQRPPATDPLGVRRFLISFEEDIPVEPGTSDFSRPGKPLLNQIVTLDPDGKLTAGSGTFTEKQTPFGNPEEGPTFEYNAELHLGKAFHQQPDTVYWLKIVALVDVNPDFPVDEQLLWGWHNRDYTINDPLASVAPNVFPGEHVQGFLPAAGGDTRIWHFQDDSVNGFVDVKLNPDMPFMPEIVQDVGGPQFYLPPYDGPSLIGQYSKDLAFELYTVPEPSTLMLGVLALVGLAGAVRRKK